MSHQQPKNTNSLVVAVIGLILDFPPSMVSATQLARSLKFAPKSRAKKAYSVMVAKSSVLETIKGGIHDKFGL